MPTVMNLSCQASLRGGAYHPSAASRAAVARGVLLLGLVSPWLLFSSKTTNFVQPALPRQNRWLRAQITPTLAATGFLTRRTPRLFARPPAIRRRGTTTRPIPATSAPLVANRFAAPSAGDTPVVLLLDHGYGETDCVLQPLASGVFRRGEAGVLRVRNESLQA